MGRGFRALEIRNYRLYWIGQLISQSGSWMQRTAQDWLVLELTKSPTALGIVTALQFLPIMLLSLIGGVITDRWPKHRLLVITQAAALVQAAIFTLLVMTGIIQLWHVYLLALLQGIITAIDNPLRQAFVVELVGREHLVNAVALNSMTFNGARIIGPSSAGMIIAYASTTLGGVALVLLINTVTFLAVLWGLLLMNRDELHISTPAPAGNVFRRVREGLVYVWHNPTAMQIMIIVGAIGTFGYNFSVIIPLLAEFVLHTDAAGFGNLSAFLGFGSLVGALGTAYMRQVTLRRLVLASFSFSILLALVAISTNFLLSGALLIVLGFSGILFSTSANSLLQLSVPDELRGRVLSLYMLLFAGSTPIGALLMGTLSEYTGVSYALLFCALLCVAGVLSAIFYGWRHDRVAQT
jgi:MFS family permease